MAIRHRSTIGIPTDGFSGIFSAIFWIAVLAAGGYGVFWAIGAIKGRADSEVEKNAPKAMDAHRREQRTNAAGSGARNGPPVFPVTQVSPELDRAAAEVNLQILNKEAARLRGDTSLQMDLARGVTAARNRFNLVANRENVLPELLQGSDEVIGMNDQDLQKLPPAQAARTITQAISSIPAGTFMKVRVRRSAEIDVMLYFASASGSSSALAAPGYVKISNALALEIQNQVLSQPSELLVESERKQIETILGKGEATDAEYQMLLAKLRSASTAARTPSSSESFTRQIEKLRAFLPKAPVPEAIVMKDGRRFTGKLLAETPAAVSVRTVVGDITVAKDDVERIITAADQRAEFQSKFGAGDKYSDALVQLLGWTFDNDMPVHRELVAYTILQKNPMEATARGAAGYVQIDGQWTLKTSIASGAPIPERKVETKDAIKRELESMGFVLRGSKWFSRVPWSTGINSLMNPGAIKIAYNGTQLFDWYESDTPLYRRDEKMKKLTGPKDLKFIAPTQQQGSVTILVEAPGEFVECSVRATGAIIEDKSGGRIECFLTAADGKSEVLYDISSKADFANHEVSAYVRGKHKFTITARMVTVKDTYQTYARFLPSNKDTTQAFWVKGVILKPASEFDRIYADAK